MDERLREFLDIASTANWRSGRHVPAVWSAQFREAMSESFVKIGFGGAVNLTVLGELARRGDDGQAPTIGG